MRRRWSQSVSSAPFERHLRFAYAAGACRTIPAIVSERAQRTIGSAVEIKGVGLHTGEDVTLRLLPADAGVGIVFRRVDLDDSPEVPGRIEYMHDAPRRTCLRNGTAEIHTTEHLLAALSVAQIDNVICELNSAELPGVDGSSLPFLDAITDAKIKEQKEPVIVHSLRDPIHVSDGEWTIAIHFARSTARSIAGPGIPLTRSTNSRSLPRSWK